MKHFVLKISFPLDCGGAALGYLSLGGASFRSFEANGYFEA